MMTGSRSSRTRAGWAPGVPCSTATQPTPNRSRRSAGSGASKASATAAARGSSPARRWLPTVSVSGTTASTPTYRGIGSRTVRPSFQSNDRYGWDGSTTSAPAAGSPWGASRTSPQLGGYWTGDKRPPTPQARSGSAARGSRAAPPATTVAAMNPPLQRDTDAASRAAPKAAAGASASEYQARNFVPSRNSPAPGKRSTAHASAPPKAPDRLNTMPRTARTASASVAVPPMVGRSRATPPSARPIHASVMIAAVQRDRLSGTTSEFQMPPRVSTLPTRPSGESGWAAKASTAPGSDVDDVGVNTPGTSHGSWSRTQP